VKRRAFAGLLALAACSSSDAPSSGNAAADRIVVDASSPGSAVPDDFFGISLEWSSVKDYLGDGSGALRTANVALLRAFADDGHVPVVRIGGNSQDTAWWKDASSPRPQGVTIDLGPAEIAILDALTRATGCSLVLGLNVRTADSANAALLVGAATATLPPDRIQAFELGNEPDSFFTDWDAYVARADAFRDGIVARVSPAPAFQWPALAQRWWLPLLDTQLANERGRIAIVSTHVYPYTVCNGTEPPDRALLLEDFATGDVAARYAPHAKAAHDAGLRFRMGEMNSVSCGGGAGVSDTYASALWAADIATALAAAGLDGVNLHTPGEHYATWVFDAGAAVDVRPVYYGLRLASMATARHGRVLPVDAHTAGRVRAFATLGDDGATRLLVLREDAASGEIRVRLAGSSASLVRMRAPALDATRGVTLGGATYDGTTDGALVGALRAEDVARDGDDWLVRLDAYEGGVLTIAR
jgi:hypothetical protein